MPSFKCLDLNYDNVMIKKIIQATLPEIKRIFKTEDSRFILSVGLKVTGISLIITLAVYWFIIQVTKLNYAFFKAHGFPEFKDSSPFFDLINGEVIEVFPSLFTFHIFLFFIGCYVGWLLLRPFKHIGDYSEGVIENPNMIYRVDEFSTYTLLSRFSEFFFEYLRDSRDKKFLRANSIPPRFSKIHKPVLDRVFMLHFGLLLIIIAVCSSVFIIENTSAIFISIVELALKTLPNQNGMSRYFSEQMFILDDIFNLTVFLIVLSYIFLGLHLYSKVSGAAFGIFSTMRAFMKGNHSSRVHLIGFSYTREYTRKLNKYLDYIQNNLSKEQSIK